MDNKEFKIIFNPGCARKLLHAGCNICDIKPDKENRDKTLFVFKCDEHFWKELERMNNEIVANDVADEKAQ